MCSAPVGLGANLTRMSGPPPADALVIAASLLAQDADRCPRIARRRARQGRRPWRASSARGRSRSSTRAPGCGAPATTPTTRPAAFREAMAASKLVDALAHPRDLPDQLRGPRQGDPRQVARVADDVAAGRRGTRGAAASSSTPAARSAAPLDPAIKRAGKVIGQALGDSEDCPLHLENTAGTGGTLGRSFDELAALIEAAGGGERLGVCLDSCHLLASGYDVRTTETLDAVLDECDAALGAGPAGLAASQRLADPAGLQPRPPRQHRRRRDRRRRLRDVPVRAALRGPPVRARDSGREPQRPDARQDLALCAAAAQARPQAPQRHSTGRQRGPPPPVQR